MQVTSKGSDQTAHMRRLISGFAGCTYHIVGNLMLRLNYVKGPFMRFWYLWQIICSHFLNKHAQLSCANSTGLDNKNFQRKIVNIFLPIYLTVLLITHNICYG